jgi:hypothetical protein
MSPQGGSAFGHVTAHELLARLPRLQKQDAVVAMTKLRAFEANGWTIELTRSSVNQALYPDQRKIELGRLLTSGNVGRNLQQLNIALDTQLQYLNLRNNPRTDSGEEIWRTIKALFDEIESWRDVLA